MNLMNIKPQLFSIARQNICIFYALDKLMQLFEIFVTLTKTNWNGTLLELIVDAQVIVRFLFVFPNSVNF